MSYPIYYVEENDTLPHLFASYDGGTGASITLSGLATSDIEIYKDGGTTQRSSDAGYTLLDTDGIDFDGITGIHGFSIDLSNNTDAGFYAVGPWYHVVISSVTVDGQTVNFVACAFRIVSATRGMAGTALPNAAADAAGGLIISDAGGLDADAMRSDVAAILVDTGTTLQAELDGIQADTEDIQSRLPAALVGGRIDATIDATGLEAGALALINTEVDTALADIHLDHLLAATYDPAAKPGAADALLNELVEDDAGVSRFTANSLEQAPTGGSAPTAAQIADAVWDEAQADHVSAGSFGVIASEIADILVDTAEIGAAGAGLTEAGGTGDQLTAIPWNAAWDAEVQSEVTDGLNAYDPPTKAEMDSAFTEIKGATWSAASDTLEHIRDKETDLETDTQDIQSRLPAALVSGRMSADAVAVSGSTTAADNLETAAAKLALSSAAIISGACVTGTLSTTVATTDLTGYDNDQLIGRTIYFTSGPADGEATAITDYASASGTITYDALTIAPQNGNTFVIL